MTEFMRSLANDIVAALGPEGRLVAIDGVDGSGKTSFAANLAAEVHPRPVILIHADDFLNPSPIRHAQGRQSPEGFWSDTYNYPALRESVLVPLGPNGHGRYSPASYSPLTDQAAPAKSL